MKIAIISDTHDNVASLKRAIDLIKKEEIKLIIHCGDIFLPDTLKKGLKSFQGKVHVIFSRADADFSRIPEYSFKNLPGIKVWEEFGQIKLNKKTTTHPPHPPTRQGASGPLIAFCHFPEIARNLANSQKYDLVFYGHTHKPWEEKIGKTRLVNPGNLAGLFYKATFAIYDTKNDKLELKILEKLNS